VVSVLKSGLSTIFECVNLERFFYSAVVNRTVVAELVLSWRRRDWFPQFWAVPRNVLQRVTCRDST